MKRTLNLDSLDRRIIAELQRDASLSNPDLAQRVSSTSPSCWRRVKALEEMGVFRQTVRLADQELLGQGVNVLCHVRMQSHTTDSVDAFENFIRGEPRVMECFSMSGDWDYLIRIVAEDVGDYEAFLMRTLLKHPSVGSASSNFSLRVVKYQTELPIAQ